MPNHVFIGAGPTGLTNILTLIRREKHAALTENRQADFANILLLDPRLILDETVPHFDREKARANIFRFTKEYQEELYRLGVSKTDFASVSHDRRYENRAFQQGDEKVFGRYDYTQIQIRDLQKLLIEAIMRESGGQVQFSNQKIAGKLNDETEIRDKLATVIPDNFGYAPVELHIATGALRDDPESDSILYPAQLYQTGLSDISLDTVGMPVIPEHGTQTFKLPGIDDFDYQAFRNILERFQGSIDDSQWRNKLKQHGWQLQRPPRVRIFFANDILYVGAEVPEAFEDLWSANKPDGSPKPSQQKKADRETYQNKIQAYTADIASLAFSILDNDADLGLNHHFYGKLTPFQSAQFNTARGERGVALQNFDENFNHPTFQAPIKVFHEGDRRYLPHYQTGSGFVTAFMTNLVEEDIYSKNNFEDLIIWAITNDHVDADFIANKKLKDGDGNIIARGIDALKQEYMTLTKSDEHTAFKAFQDEMFTTVSRSIIDANKSKVQKYFLGLQKQTLDEMSKVFGDTIRDKYPHLPDKYHSLAAVELLKTSSDKETKKFFSATVNAEMISDDKLQSFKDMFILNAEKCFSEEYLAQYKQDFIDAIFIDKLSSTEQGTENYKLFKNLERFFSAKQTTVELKGSMNLLISSFERSSELFQRKNPVGAFFAGYLGVSGKHTSTIKQFIKDVRRLEADLENHPKQELDIKKNLVETIANFHRDLGNSKRSMKVLQETVEKIPANLSFYQYTP